MRKIKAINIKFNINILKMNNLKLNYLVERKDIEIKEKKILLKYSNVMKKHKNLILRFDTNYDNDKLLININSVKKIFSFLEFEIPEEFVLFLFEKSEKTKYIENIMNNDKQNEQEENDEKKEFLTLEVENPPVLKKYRTLTYQIMKKYYFIFCVISFLIAILFTLHLFSYLISKEVSILLINNL